MSQLMLQRYDVKSLASFALYSWSVSHNKFCLIRWRETFNTYINILYLCQLLNVFLEEANECLFTHVKPCALSIKQYFMLSYCCCRQESFYFHQCSMFGRRWHAFKNLYKIVIWKSKNDKANECTENEKRVEECKYTMYLLSCL